MKSNYYVKTSLYILLVASMAALTVGFNDAYAAVPQFDTFVADDPDDLDNTFSDDDTLTITFNIATNATGGAAMLQGEIDANFTLGGGGAPDFGTTYSGVWSADSTTLTITVTDAIGGSLTIGTTTIAGAAGTNIADADGGNADTINNGGDTATLSGNFGLFEAATSGGFHGCSDCIAPTLGKSDNGRQLVQNGFSYNGNPVDAERFFTPYPLIKTKVGAQNIAEFKIYENGGPNDIRHFEFAFGLAEGQAIGTSNAKIVWEKNFAGIETLYVIDPKNTLQSVKVESSHTKCSDDNGLQCLSLKVYHTFRAPLDFNIVGTNVWDENRNAWQNYFNHGVEIEGDSLNPPMQHQVIHKGKLVTITESDKNRALDENGNIWTLNQSWEMDYIPLGKIDDGITMHLLNRDDARFNTYKQGQELLAKQMMIENYGDILGAPFAEINAIKSTPLSDSTDGMSDLKLQKEITKQISQAELTYQRLYGYLDRIVE